MQPWADTILSATMFVPSGTKEAPRFQTFRANAKRVPEVEDELVGAKIAVVISASMFSTEARSDDTPRCAIRRTSLIGPFSETFKTFTSWRVIGTSLSAFAYARIGAVASAFSLI